MPLHLLGKKSWNVYNPANIARVWRDEDAARAQEEAEEQRMQTFDAAHRLAILRGEVPPPLEEPEPASQEALPPPRTHDHNISSTTTDTRRKRKRHGEDDTDFEMRLAKERATATALTTRNLGPNPTPPAASLTLTDSKGHLTLFPDPSSTVRRHEPNEEVTLEAARKERNFKDQYQMRFINAGSGKDGQGLTDGGPWYVAADGEAAKAAAALVPSKNVFGRDDPGRKGRAAARLDKSDPLAMMKSGAARVREVERERRREMEETDMEVKRMDREEREKKREREAKRTEAEWR
ncbi:hypothetical protein N0V88_000094 [Collariella sp. IMI 366227]|nr:hypothetical protein N0V88_000094 [Collariella sp. IMI 366227]